jgi:2-oxoisovalerate dehydrogenase E1 component
MTSELSQDDRLELYRQMVTIRRFEEAATVLYRDGEVPGFVHISIGQEGTAVGACWPLRRTDGIVSNHRGHGHCLAKGADPAGMMAELMGKATGTCGGLGGSMHIADVAQGIFGANGIVGAGLPIACGVGAAMKQRKTDDVVVAFFGDGAVAQGAFHEALNLAAVWHLPVVFFCENNGYAEFSPFDRQHPVPVRARGSAYGIEPITVDGNDVEAVVAAMSAVVERCRAGNGPALVEGVTYRQHGHYEGDPQRYRTADEREEWQAKDPIALLASRYETAAGKRSVLDEIDQAVAVQLELAIEKARAAPVATLAEARAALSAARTIDVESPATGDASDGYKVMDAVRDALNDAMEEDPSVWLAGIDVEAGNIFGVTRGLLDAFPGRVLDTPISETALLGCGVGAAMAGTRPVVELMYLDFMGVAFDQLLNQAAKLRFMTGGAASVPLVVRTQFGAGRSSGAQHSQSLEALLAHVPGLTVLMPSTPADTYGLLRAAIADNNPVVIIDHRLLYGKKGAKPAPGHMVPIGKGIVRRPGKDLTVISWSRMVDYAMQAAEVVAGEGIDAEVIDMRTVAPLDIELVVESVRRTGRLLVAHEAVITGGLGAEIVAQITERCFFDLDAPVVRVAPEFLPAPYSPTAEHDWLVEEPELTAAIRALAAV